MDMKNFPKTHFLINTNNEDNIQLLYYWKYEDSIIESYGYLSDSKNLMNIHKLPNNGLSNMLFITGQSFEMLVELATCDTASGISFILNVISNPTLIRLVLNFNHILHVQFKRLHYLNI